MDGVIEINQARAEAGGVTPGDGAGFPVTLSEPGSYVLTGNLDVPSGTTGIEITTDDVTVDLNGFTIAGNGGGAGDGVTSFAGALHGRITVHNGVVRSMGGDGIQVGGQSRVEAIHAQGNGAVGILAGFSSTVTGNTALDNGGEGIDAASGSTVTGNSARSNGSDGILASSASTVTGNTALDNGDDGIDAGNGSTVIGNTARSNTDFGLNLAKEAGYKDNVLINNNSGNTNAQVNSGIEIGTNVCGTDTTCP